MAERHLGAEAIELVVIAVAWEAHLRYVAFSLLTTSRELVEIRGLLHKAIFIVVAASVISNGVSLELVQASCDGFDLHWEF